MTIDLSNIQRVGDETYHRPIFAWLLNTVCQYRCTYCFYQEYLNKTEPEQNQNAYKRVLKRLAMKSLPGYEVDIIGGEPTLHKNVFEILETLNSYEKCEKLTINTNLARPVEWYNKLDDVKYNKLNITASYHPEYNVKDVDKYVKKSIQLSSTKHISYICNINIYEKSWEQTKPIIERLLDNNVPVGFNTLDPVEKVWEVTYSKEFKTQFKNYIEFIKNKYDFNPVKEEFIDFIDKQNKIHKISDYQIRVDKLDRYKGWDCEAIYWSIDPDGRIYNMCTGEDLHLLNKNISEVVTCPVDKGCPCQDCFKFPKHNKHV